MSKTNTHIFYTKWFQVLCLLGIILTHLVSWFTHYVFHPVYSIFLGLLLITLTNNNSGAFLNRKIIVFLGKLSYGMYMLHIVVITMTLKTVLFFFPASTLASQNSILYIFSFFITFSSGVLSYYIIETPFLRLKGKIK